MSRLHQLTAAALLALVANASATSFVVTTDATVGAIGATSEATSDIPPPSVTTKSCWPHVTTPPAS